jgi:hypothetical protein
MSIGLGSKRLLETRVPLSRATLSKRSPHDRKCNQEPKTQLKCKSIALLSKQTLSLRVA